MVPSVGQVSDCNENCKLTVTRKQNDNSVLDMLFRRGGSAVKSAKEIKQTTYNYHIPERRSCCLAPREVACDLLNLYESGHCATDSYAREYHTHKPARVCMLSFWWRSELGLLVCPGGLQCSSQLPWKFPGPTLQRVRNTLGGHCTECMLWSADHCFLAPATTWMPWHCQTLIH